MLVPRSEHLSDDAFLDALLTCSLAPSQFNHADHLRLGWIAVHAADFDKALGFVRETIRNFAVHHGAGHIYHETMTIAWTILIASHAEASFAEFLSVNDSRLNAKLLHRFWTPSLLQSDAARKEWVKPDLSPLPIPLA